MKIGRKASPVPLFFLALVLLLSFFRLPAEGAGSTKRKRISFKARAAYFRPSARSFMDIYAGGWMGEGEINIRLVDFVELWLLGNYYSGRGRLPITQEATRMTLGGAGGGLKFRARIGVFNPYAALGTLVYFYKERNPIGTAKGNKAGYIGQVGFCFTIARGLLLDAFLSYTRCKVRPQKIRVDIGGLYGGLGLGFAF